MVENDFGKTGVSIKSHAMMYKAVVQAVIHVIVQAVLLYMSEIFVVTDVIMAVLEEFHHRTARQIS